MLLVNNSSPIARPPCGCGAGLGVLKMIPRRMRSPGLGDSSANPTYDQLLAIATKNGVDPAAFAKLAASGADLVTLTLVATGGQGVATAQSETDTVNQDVGSSNYPLTLGATSPMPPPTPSTPLDFTGFLTTYGGWIIAGVVGYFLLKKL